LGGEKRSPKLHKHFLFNGTADIRDDLITPKLSKVIDNIAKGIPGYYCGRFDIRYYNTEDLKDGRNFYILEANGSMGFDLRYKAYPYLSPKSWWNRFRFILVRLWYGFLNICKRNNLDLGCIKRSLSNAVRCNDWEKLYCVYS
jgi:hypothetical protein